ncbi:cupin domain-containing protein [Skermanella rosea]|uniref:cupin domain-containing protein n=1 Tax=Skermanella rosea TaxID=1817965 RepID=UPI00193432F0|nr:cupin domain-containing protein [Skermanella rosea]UEM04048.1 cupin domain-containing protein [Skermanella rosea]
MTGAKHASGTDSPDIRIGVKLRHARLVRGLRMSDVARRVGCSESLISKLEHDKAKPSFVMLHKLVAALETNVAYLFADAGDSAGPVARAGERPVITTDPLRNAPGIRLERLIPYAEGHLLQANIHIIDPGSGSDGEIEHDGEEVGYVLEGALELTVGGQVHSLSAGDSFVFRSDLSHGYRNPGDTTTRVLWVNTPPTF